jgi:hypothetical protein
MKKEKTDRGFALRRFKDRIGVECTIQKSSIATEDCIWLGAERIGLQIGHPWKDISEEEIKAKFNAEHLIANNRMHLTIKQVKKLLPILNKFVETGEI